MRCKLHAAAPHCDRLGRRHVAAASPRGQSSLTGAPLVKAAEVLEVVCTAHLQKLDEILDAANVTGDDEGRARVKKLMGRIKELGKRLCTIANHAGRAGDASAEQ
jgi:hypothetical protein